MHQARNYRHWIRDTDLVASSVTVKETDLYIRAAANLQRKAHRLVLKYRGALEGYIEKHPLFLTSLKPVKATRDTPHIAREMIRMTERVGVGPMAAVAGAIAEFVGGELLAFSPEIIIENGGDIFLKTLQKRVIGIYAGNSPLSGKIGLEIAPADTPLGVCTSSGTVGHSLSFGNADAVVVLARSATLADAAATAIGNIIMKPDDIARGIEFAQGVIGLTGVVIIIGDKMGLWGDVKLCQTQPETV